MRDCVKRIVETSKGQINAKNAKAFLGMVDRMAARMVDEGFDYDEAVAQAVKQLRETTQNNIARQKANMAKNVLIKASAVDKISQFIDSGMSIVDAFRADREGINSPVEGARASLEVAKNGVEYAYFSRFIGELNREGLLPLLNSKTLNDEIGKELWALSIGERGATQSKEAAKIAEIIYKTREGQRMRLNRAGADIQQTAGYIMPQRHDTAEMFRVKEDKWVSDMLPLVDTKRSFGGVYDNLEDALRSAYRAMVSGIRLNDPLENNPKLFQFDGPANLAKRMSQSRQIHFKDYASWKQWNETYGMKDLNEGILDSIRYDSHNIAIMERDGTNPEAMMKAVADDIKKKYRDKAAKEGEIGIDAKISEMINAALEKDMIPANPKLATLGANVRAYNNVTMLGGALLSSVTDIPMKSLEYQFQGKSWLSATVQPFMDIASGFKSKKERIEFASMVGVGFEHLIGDMGARFSAQDTLSNKAAKVQRLFFKLNGLTWWTDTHKGAMGRVMAHDLGLKKAIEFDSLDADTKRLFGNYGIAKKDWDAMRKSAVTLEDGRDYILADKIDDDKLREKLVGYFVDRTNTGVITPGVRERRIMTAGTQRGTAAGEAMRLIMQFKSFPVATINRVWGRALYGKGKADIPAMAYLMLMTMAFGYMAGAAKDLLKNKTPKDPRKLETAFASLAQGGGLGILGDVLLQDGNGFGRGLTQTLAGPTFGRLDDVFKIYSAGIRGGGSAGQAVRTGISLIPFNNLFYTRAALDQILLLEMQEDLNPGYLRRMEQNMRKTYGQELLFK